MSDIPNFRNDEDENHFYDLFDEKLIQYKFLLDKVRDVLFDGNGVGGSYANVPGSFLDVLHRITRDLSYDTVVKFESERPEYKEDHDSVFVNRNELKSSLKEALSEINTAESLKDFTLGQH